MSSFGCNRGGGWSSRGSCGRRGSVGCRASADLVGEFVVDGCSGVELCRARLGEPGLLGRVGLGLVELISKPGRRVGVGVVRLVEQHVPALVALFGFGQFGVEGDEFVEFGLECCSASAAQGVSCEPGVVEGVATVVDAVGCVLFGSDLPVGLSGSGLTGEERSQFGRELRGASCALVGDAFDVLDGGLHAFQSGVGVVEAALEVGQAGVAARRVGLRAAADVELDAGTVGLLAQTRGDRGPLLASPVGCFEVRHGMAELTELVVGCPCAGRVGASDGESVGGAGLA